MEDPLADRIDIRRWDGEGYRIVVDSPNEGWMLAIKNYTPVAEPTAITALQMHPNSDEAFVLLRGKSALIVGEGDDQVTAVRVLPMEPETVYNVRRNVWHSTIMSRDAVLLIAENSDTEGVEAALSAEQIAIVRAVSL